MFRENAIYLITRVYYKINRYLTKELVTNSIAGLAPSHGEIIGALWIRGRLQMKELAEFIDKDKSTITALVNKLLKLDYVEKEKDADDNRISYISLTEKGKNLNPVIDDVAR